MKSAAIFNIGIFHEGSLFRKGAAKPRRVKPEEVDLPPYLRISTRKGSPPCTSDSRPP